MSRGASFTDEQELLEDGRGELPSRVSSLEKHGRGDLNSTTEAYRHQSGTAAL